MAKNKDRQHRMCLGMLYKYLILSERTARFECNNSGRAAFFVLAKIAEFMVNLMYAAVWYRRMAIQYSPQRESVGNEKTKIFGKCGEALVA